MAIYLCAACIASIVAHIRTRLYSNYDVFNQEIEMCLEWLTSNKPLRHWVTLGIMFAVFVTLVLS